MIKINVMMNHETISIWQYKLNNAIGIDTDD